MPAPLAAQPLWLRLMIVSIVLPAVITLAVLAFAWPAARVQPRDVPVGVVGPASPTVAQLLTNVRAKLAAGTSSTQSSTDVVPLSQADPRGIVFGSLVLPVTVSGIAIAVMIGLVARFRPAWRQIGALLVVSMAAGASVYLIGQSFLGALPHQGLADWAALSLTVLAIGATAAGLLALVGVAGLGIAGALMVFVGNPFSGVTSAPELLPDAIKHLGQALPPGAGVNLLRSTAYFDGHRAVGHVVVLITWAVLGCAAIAIGQHTSIRFAAHSARRSAPAPSRLAGQVPGEPVTADRAGPS